MEALQAIRQLPQAAGVSAFDSFIAFIDVGDAAQAAYIAALRYYGQWAKAAQMPFNTRESVLAYKAHLQQSDLTARTVNNYLQPVKAFSKWYATEGGGYDFACNIKPVRVSREPVKDNLEPQDFQAVLNSIDRSTEAGKRLYCLVMLGGACGLRTIELSRANIGDLKTEGGRCFLYVWGKGHAEADTPVEIVPEILEVIQDYLQSRADAHNPKAPLFVTTGNRNKGGRLPADTISRLIKGALRSAGYDSDRLTAHSLRHTGITAAAAVTGDNVYLAQQFARHGQPATTEGYIHRDKRRKDRTGWDVFHYLIGTEQSNREKLIAIIERMPENDIEALLNKLQKAEG